MSDYHSIGSKSRLGGFELHGVSNTFGNQGFGDEWDDMFATPAGGWAEESQEDSLAMQREMYKSTEDYQRTGEMPSSLAKKESGANAGEVLGGIGSILGAIAGPLSSIFVSHQNAQLQLELIKSGRSPVQQARARPGLKTSAAAAKSGTNTAIIAIVVGVVLIGAMFMMSRKK